MSFLQRLFGGADEPEPRRGRVTRAPGSDDERALARYRYLLQTAPPETIEQAHAEAFARLTPEQRRMVLQGLAEDVPAAERTASSDDPRSLARLATRAEMRQPGTLERRFGGMGMPGMGSMMAGSFLSTIAGVMVGSAIADAFLGDSGFTEDAAAAEGEGGDLGAEGDAGDAGRADTGGDLGGGGFGDFGGGDFGGDFGGEF